MIFISHANGAKMELQRAIKFGQISQIGQINGQRRGQMRQKIHNM
jgi:hypothetical protein